MSHVLLPLIASRLTASRQDDDTGWVYDYEQRRRLHVRDIFKEGNRLAQDADAAQPPLESRSSRLLRPV